MQTYKKTNDLSDFYSQSTSLELKYLTLADEITCLASLLQAEEQLRSSILRDPLVDDILIILSHYQTDPVLLTSVCKFAHSFFSRPELLFNVSADFQLPLRLNKTKNLKQLIPYLGLKKYGELFKSSRKYNSSPYL